MTTINFLGQNYDPAGSLVMYEITKDDTDAQDVAITVSAADKTITGTKQIFGSYATINVADYIRPALNTYPVNETASWEAIGRVAKVSVEQAECRITNSKINPMGKKPRLLSDLTERTISYGDTDEVSISFPDAAIAGGIELTQAGCIAFQIVSKGDNFIEEVCGIPVAYRIIPKCGKRLCWINKYGAIDYWTFETIESRDVEVSRDKIYTSNGWMAVNIEVEESVKVTTRNLSTETLAALSEILSSPRVWCVDDDFMGIDIKSDSVSVYTSKGLNKLTIEYRPKISK